MLDFQKQTETQWNHNKTVLQAEATAKRQMQEHIQMLEGNMKDSKARHVKDVTELQAAMQRHKQLADTQLLSVKSTAKVAADHATTTAAKQKIFFEKALQSAEKTLITVQEAHAREVKTLLAQHEQSVKTMKKDGEDSAKLLQEVQKAAQLEKDEFEKRKDKVQAAEALETEVAELSAALQSVRKDLETCSADLGSSNEALANTQQRLDVALTQIKETEEKKLHYKNLCKKRDEMLAHNAKIAQKLLDEAQNKATAAAAAAAASFDKQLQEQHKKAAAELTASQKKISAMEVSLLQHKQAAEKQLLDFQKQAKAEKDHAASTAENKQRYHEMVLQAEVTAKKQMQQQIKMLEDKLQTSKEQHIKDAHDLNYLKDLLQKQTQAADAAETQVARFEDAHDKTSEERQQSQEDMRVLREQLQTQQRQAYESVNAMQALQAAHDAALKQAHLQRHAAEEQLQNMIKAQDQESTETIAIAKKTSNVTRAAPPCVPTENGTHSETYILCL